MTWKNSIKLSSWMSRVALALITAVNMFKRNRKRRKKREKVVKIERNVEHTDVGDNN